MSSTLRDDFDRVTQGLRHYEDPSPDASFVVLIPEQSAVIEESERNRGFARKSAFLAAMQSNGIVVERLTVSARDVVDAVRVSERQLAVLSSLRPEDLIPADHPIPRSTVAPPAIAAIS